MGHFKQVCVKVLLKKLVMMYNFMDNSEGHSRF